MNQAGLSQAALARRVGVSQQAIARLASGEVQGSKHLHRIARELGTTPAYLTSETDDPLADAPDVPFVSTDEQQLIDCFRVMTPKDRAAFLQIGCTMAGRFSAPQTFHAPGVEFHHEGSKR